MSAADDSNFVGYVGNPDIHDGMIVAVESHGSEVRVIIDTNPAQSGRRITIFFHGVKRVLANHPEGMVLYALSEWTAYPPRRRFVFANWHEADDPNLDEKGTRLADASLEVFAAGFRILDGTLSD